LSRGAPRPAHRHPDADPGERLGVEPGLLVPRPRGADPDFAPHPARKRQCERGRDRRYALGHEQVGGDAAQPQPGEARRRVGGEAVEVRTAEQLGVEVQPGERERRELVDDGEPPASPIILKRLGPADPP
jgi:hypothetical protein